MVNVVVRVCASLIIIHRLCWYVGDKYLRDLKGREEFSERVLKSVEALADFLVSEARLMERGSDGAKKEAREQVPGDRVKDAPALARELRWRVRQASGHLSDDDGEPTVNLKVNGVKRKTEDDQSMGLFRHFQPRKWDQINDRPTEEEKRTITTRRSESLEGWTEAWLDKPEHEDWEEDEVDLCRKRTVIVKTRRTESGIERQRVERVLEQWVWHSKPPQVEDVKVE
jgi:F-box/leucine-rich repeat protein 10/11